jgi:hypothetical protein
MGEFMGEKPSAITLQERRLGDDRVPDGNGAETPEPPGRQAVEPGARCWAADALRRSATGNPCGGVPDQRGGHGPERAKLACRAALPNSRDLDANHERMISEKLASHKAPFAAPPEFTIQRQEQRAGKNRAEKPIARQLVERDEKRAHARWRMDGPQSQHRKGGEANSGRGGCLARPSDPKAKQAAAGR